MYLWTLNNVYFTLNNVFGQLKHVLIILPEGSSKFLLYFINYIFAINSQCVIFFPSSVLLSVFLYLFLSFLYSVQK